MSNQEITEAQEVMSAETAFIIVKSAEGSYTAYTNLGINVEAAKVATIDDIRQGCQSLYESINREVVVQTVLARLAPKSEEEVEEVNPTE
jgi:biotin-(acetyl-CoA carboxylase) ligase